MKRLLLFFRLLGLIGLVFLMTSCGGRHSAKRTAKAFLQYYYVENDFEGAKTVSTDATYENLDFKAMMFTLNPFSESESISDFKITKVQARKTKAVCSYEVGGDGRRLNLSKVDGRWFVDMPEGTTIEPSLSLSQSRNQGGFASAESARVRLGDLPDASKKDTLPSK